MAFEEKDYNDLIVQTYQKYKEPELPFSVLFEDVGFKERINSSLETSLGTYQFKGTSDVSSTASFYNSFSFGGTDYEPIVNLINPEKADFNLPPIISPGIEAPDDFESGAVNCVVAWFNYGKKEEVQIVLTEEALNSKWPIYVISSITDKDKALVLDGRISNRHLNLERRAPSKKGALAIDRISSKEYRINHRYEGQGQSELRKTVFRLWLNGSDWIIDPITDWRTKDWCDKIDNIDAGDVGTDLEMWLDFSDYYGDPYDNHIHFNTFERDWWAGRKGIGDVAMPDGDVLYIVGCMTLEGEWYHQDPSDINWADPLDQAYINQYWALWFTNSKGHFRLWRID